MSRSEQGEAVRIEILCISCAFGAVVKVPPARCPMCGSSSWACVAPTGSGRIAGNNDVPRNEQEQRTTSLTASASHGGPRAEKGASHGRT